MVNLARWMIIKFIILIRKGKNFFYNNKKVIFQGNILGFFKNFKHLQKKIYLDFEKRFEKKIYKLNFNKFEIKFIQNYLDNTTPLNTNFDRHMVMKPLIFLLNLNFKGCRHFKGYPVNGQNTRNNSKNTQKCNLLLRIFKMKQAKRFYGNLPTNELNTALSAEYINLVYFANYPDA